MLVCEYVICSIGLICNLCVVETNRSYVYCCVELIFSLNEIMVL